MIGNGANVRRKMDREKTEEYNFLSAKVKKDKVPGRPETTEGGLCGENKKYRR
jgi:hypothetical protein